MQIVFSGHALLKLRQRNISQGLVMETVRTPDFTKPSRHFREERYKRFGKNYLKAVVVEERDILIVITAHWLAKGTKK